jgi:1,4-dihydroxy-2-naphthoyl-CoA synthase
MSEDTGLIIDEQGAVARLTLHRAEQLNSPVAPLVVEERLQALVAFTEDRLEAQDAFFGKRQPGYEDR